MSWLPFAICSGVAISIEVLLLKSIKNKYENVYTDLIAWIYRIFSVGFISIYLICKFYTLPRCERDTLSLRERGIKNSIWKILLMGLMSAVAVVSYYKAISSAPNVGLPPAINALYIPLTFLGGFVFLGENYRKVKWQTYTGMGLLVVGMVLIGWTGMVTAEVDADPTI